MAAIIHGFAPSTPNQQETVRLYLMRRTAERLAQMNLANGYSRDYADIWYGQSLSASFEEGPPRVYLFDQDETSETIVSGKDHKSVEVNVEALALIPDDEPLSAAALHNNKILADVTRAIFTDPLTNQLDEFFLTPEGYAMADGLVYFRSEAVFPFGENRKCGTISTWVLSYHTVKGKPHLTREED